MTEEKTDTPCLCHECSIIPKVQLSMAAALARKFDAEMMAGKGADRSFIPARESDVMYIAELEKRNDQLQKDVAALEKTIVAWARISPRASIGSDRIGERIYRQSYSTLLRRWFGA